MKKRFVVILFFIFLFVFLICVYINSEYYAHKHVMIYTPQTIEEENLFYKSWEIKYTDNLDEIVYYYSPHRGDGRERTLVINKVRDLEEFFLNNIICKDEISAFSDGIVIRDYHIDFSSQIKTISGEEKTGSYFCELIDTGEYNKNTDQEQYIQARFSIYKNSDNTYTVEMGLPYLYTESEYINSIEKREFYSEYLWWHTYW